MTDAPMTDESHDDTATEEAPERATLVSPEPRASAPPATAASTAPGSPSTDEAPGAPQAPAAPRVSVAPSSAAQGAGAASSTDAAPASASSVSSPVSASPGSASPGSASPVSAAPPPPPKDPLVEAKADVERFREQWMRTAADFDNFRKRTRREVEDAKRSGKEDLLKELLPVFDNLERGIQSSQRAQDVKALADGLSMILKQFVDTLGRVGISRIAGVGSAFDPSLHEAIQQVETSDHPPGLVIAEVQPGYMQGERLVRAAMVVVSKAPSGGEGAGDANN